MNNTQNDALIRSATKGDNESLRKLFALGEQLLIQGNLEEAAKIFRESAICYRIEAFRNSALYQDTERRERELKSYIDRYNEWFDRQEAIFDPLPRFCDGITRNIIITIMRDEIREDDSMQQLLYFIVSALVKHGATFSSPGASDLRQICDHLCDYFGLRFDRKNYLNYPDVRIGIDLLADEISKRYILKRDEQ